MKASEHELCVENGVTDVTEVLIGFDGLSLAHSNEAPDIDVTKAQIFLALAEEVPVDGEIVANPYTNWSEIDASLPDQPILVYGPPPTSGTRDAWVELVMEEGCGEFEAITALDEDRHDEVCQRMRTDGVFVEAGENDNLIIQRLVTDPDAFGIFGYSFLYENLDRLTGAADRGRRRRRPRPSRPASTASRGRSSSTSRTRIAAPSRTSTSSSPSMSARRPWVPVATSRSVASCRSATSAARPSRTLP